jgi:hypothetical protein
MYKTYEGGCVMATIDSGKINIIADFPSKKLEESFIKKIKEADDGKNYVHKTYNGRKMPFEAYIWDTEPQEVENPFTGDKCMLEPDAVAVYDMVKGAEMLGQHDLVRKGIMWFREHFPKEYRILLD